MTQSLGARGETVPEIEQEQEPAPGTAADAADTEAPADTATPDEKKQVPELVLDDKVHRAWFDDLMNDMGGAHGHSKQSDESKDDKKADNKAVG